MPKTVKLIEKDGKYYRLRRGVLVEIPVKWLAKVTHKQTINKRPSKQGGRRTRKNKNRST